jgi:hypothetical protein
MKPNTDPHARVLITTEAQRFRFVVRFAALDLTTLRTGDWVNLQEDLRDFLSPTHADLRPGGLHTYPTEGHMPEEYTREDFAALQAETRDMLAMVIASRANPQAFVPKQLSISPTPPHVPALPEPHPGRHFISVQGAVRDLFLFRVHNLLAQVNTAMLTRCPECDTIFLRKSNQVYCSKKCVNRVTQRRFREREATVATATATP